MKNRRLSRLSEHDASLQCAIAQRLRHGLPLAGLLTASLFCGCDEQPSAGSQTVRSCSTPSPEARHTVDATTIFESDLNRCVWFLWGQIPTMGLGVFVRLDPADVGVVKFEGAEWAERIRKGMKTQLAVLEEQERSGKVEDARRSLELMIRGFDCLVTCESRYGSEAAKKLCREMRTGYMILALGAKAETEAKCREEIKKACRTIIGCDSEMPEKTEKALEKVLDAAIERNVREMRDDITNAMRERQNELSTAGKISRDEMPDLAALREKLAVLREELEAERKRLEKDDVGNRADEKEK